MGTFFKPHTTPIFLFLKIGIIGVIIYYWMFYRVFMYAKKSLKIINNLYHRIIVITLMVSVIVLSVNNFSSKMQITGGVFIGILFSLISLHQQGEK